MPTPEVLSFESLKWVITFVVGGYVPLVSAIGLLYLELIKSKNNEMETLRLVLPLMEKVCQIKGDLIEVCKDINEKLEELM